MGSNRELLSYLLGNGTLKFQRSDRFDYATGPVPSDFDFSRVEGMMLGLAIGDSLGNTTEGSLPGERSSRHGEIRDYLPNRYANGEAVGVPSDDTQLAFWTLEQLLEDRCLVPEHLATRFTRSNIFGIGHAVKQFLEHARAGLPWAECGVHSAGNGALMRIAPVLIPHLSTGSADLWVDASLAAALTHNDPASIGACVAFVRMLWELLSMSGPPEPGWWVQTYVETAAGIEGETTYRPRGGAFPDYHGPVWRFVQEKLPPACEQGLSVLDACNRWYSGAYLLETVPSALYILARHADDPEEAIVRAVNDTVDNDTIAAIVGAAIGALYGRDGLPERWLKGLIGRTSETDDGRVFELLSAAKAFACPAH